MKVFLKELKFPSTDHTYLKDVTDLVKDAVTVSRVENGFVLINSKHTTLGVIVQEIAEPNLVKDILQHTLKCVPEDKRSTRVNKKYQYPTTDYSHRCQDNPYCDEIDEDYNAGSHIRALSFSRSSVIVPFKNDKLELGKYQQIAIFEFDGRDGKGKNPVRARTIQIWIYPASKVVNI